MTETSSPRSPVPLRVPVTPTLEALLNPHLHAKEPIFTDRLVPPAAGEKVHSLSPSDISCVRSMRGAVVDLHPGMGGIAPDKLLDMMAHGVSLTSLDYMLT